LILDHSGPIELLEGFFSQDAVMGNGLGLQKTSIGLKANLWDAKSVTHFRHEFVERAGSAF